MHNKVFILSIRCGLSTPSCRQKPPSCRSPLCCLWSGPPNQTDWYSSETQASQHFTLSLYSSVINTTERNINTINPWDMHTLFWFLCVCAWSVVARQRCWNCAAVWYRCQEESLWDEYWWHPSTVNLFVCLHVGKDLATNSSKGLVTSSVF